ncbi:hypothetical protein ElyMa_002465900 [Elysia marginata]|uniref:Uncharacterized protein n=1 Tax=Elysia marginata TaxID=1093978 RepID=A0AAV4GKT0_9GAST|nr:hypothetical protein ElyMa_002465900 [Elysia marginata]
MPNGNWGLCGPAVRCLTPEPGVIGSSPEYTAGLEIPGCKPADILSRLKQRTEWIGFHPTHAVPRTCKVQYLSYSLDCRYCIWFVCDSAILLLHRITPMASLARRL